MDGLYWTLILLCPPVFLAHLVSTALTKALQTYSRSRLEELTEDRGRPDRAEEVDHLDEETERAAESMAVATGLFLAAAIGVFAARFSSGAAILLLVALVIVLGGVGYAVSGVLGRIFAESLIDRLWPATKPLRAVALPLTGGLAALQDSIEWLTGSAENGPRPSSVEVEIPVESDDDDGDEPELPERARDMMSHVVELTRASVSDIMRPRSAIVSLPSTSTAKAAAETFRASGRSRIPLYGKDRDDIIGVLLARDLLDHMVAEGNPDVVPARIAREAFCVPETKNAFQLLEDMRFRRAPMAIVLDEYGGVSGLVTFEDLLEELVGPIHDEYDPPAPADPVVPLGGSKFEVDAGLELEELNERFGVNLPTDEDFETVGGLALHALGRLPDPGANFQFDGIDFTVLDVGDRHIRRIRIDLEPVTEEANDPTTSQTPSGE